MFEQYIIEDTTPVARPIKLIIPTNVVLPDIFPRNKSTITIKKAFHGISFNLDDPKIIDAIKKPLRDKKSGLSKENKEWLKEWLKSDVKKLEYIAFKGDRFNGFHPWYVFLYILPGFTFDSKDKPHAAILRNRYYEMGGQTPQKAFHARTPKSKKERERARDKFMQDLIRNFTIEVGRKPTKAELKEAKERYEREVEKHHIISFIWIPWVEGRGYPTTPEINIVSSMQVGLSGAINMIKIASTEIALAGYLRSLTAMQGKVIAGHEQVQHQLHDEVFKKTVELTIQKEELASQVRPFEERVFTSPGGPGMMPIIAKEEEVKRKEPAILSTQAILAIMLIAGLLLTGAGAYYYGKSLEPITGPEGVKEFRPPEYGLLIVGILIVVVVLVLYYLNSRKTAEEEARRALMERPAPPMEELIEKPVESVAREIPEEGGGEE